MENGFTQTIDSFSYRVKRNEDESYIVFKNTPRHHRDASTKRPEYRVSEIQIVPIEEDNKLLASSSDQFELVGIDPIKVINQQFFALGKPAVKNVIPRPKLKNPAPADVMFASASVITMFSMTCGV